MTKEIIIYSTNKSVWKAIKNETMSTKVQNKTTTRLKELNNYFINSIRQYTTCDDSYRSFIKKVKIKKNISFICTPINEIEIQKIIDEKQCNRKYN